MPSEPKRHVLVDDGPLVRVETRRDSSQLKLPFDQAPRSRTQVAGVMTTEKNIRSMPL